ncbi:ATP-binding cassette domain-containing protein [Ancylobacter sp. 6x-1]|uniref:ATP-binding cassette domain-containing protein n=1 Tax=Ancylobacter crimeensis TaxID=2579147 RepID=A0ABT0DB14_9HYPH|nr:ATP-binding cassette domain-containing protein [Ancylobacter crimeensis]MCK0197137.1 ATP-binding cassette domain-containing protein [Ancylobacter crimeensis]
MSRGSRGSARSLFAVLRLFLAERRGPLLCGVLLAALTLLAGTGLLALSGWFITATAIAGLSSATALAFDVFAPSAGIRLAALTRTGARYGERLVTHDATLAVLAGLRERLFRGWAAPRAAGRLADRPAGLLFRLTLDIDALDSLYLRALLPAAAAAMVTLASIVLIGLIDLHTGLVFGLIVLGLGVLVPALGLRAARRPSRRRAHALEVLRARTIDLVAGQTELAMTGRLTPQRAAIAAADARLEQADDDLNRAETLMSSAFAIGGAGLLALMLVLAAHLVEADRIDAPAAALLLLVALAAFDPLGALRRGVVEFGRMLVAAGRIAPRLKPTEPEAAPASPGPGVAVRLTGADIAPAGAIRPVVLGADLAIGVGERVALIGASGAGKSTLIAAIAGEAGLEAGRLEALPATLLTQRTELFQDTIGGNLRIAKPDAEDFQLFDALRAAGLIEVIEALPRRLDSSLGEAALGLSGGQARRLALARLFLRPTPLWLLDEPTEGLDGTTARDVLARLAEQAAGRTLVIATHLRREAEIADRVVVLADGRLTASARRGEAAFAEALATLRED